MLHRILTHVSTFLAVSTLASTVAPLSSTSSVTPAQRSINRVSTTPTSFNEPHLLFKSTQYKTKQNQISEASHPIKSNKQAQLESTQRAVVRIVAGCTAKVYWSHNRKTYTVIAGGSGSGYFVHPRGSIVTNAHVIEPVYKKNKCVRLLFGNFIRQLARDYNLPLSRVSQDRNTLRLIAKRFRPTGFQSINLVLLSNENKLPFQIISSGAPVGEGTDIAILKVNVKNAPSLKLANSDKVKLLDRAIAIGFPAIRVEKILAAPSRYVASFTSVEVSAKKRLADGSPVIQIAGALTQGNSGGPVLNNKGEVIGMVTFGSPNVSGISFIIPSNTILKFLRQAGITNEKELVSQSYYF